MNESEAVGRYLMNVMSRCDTIRFYNVARRLHKSLRRAPYAWEVALSVLNQEAKWHLANDQMGLYRNCISTRARVFIQEKDYGSGLREYSRVLFLDANGPNNVGIQKKMREEYIAFANEYGSTLDHLSPFCEASIHERPAPGIVKSFCRCSLMLDKSLSWAEGRFIEFARAEEKLMAGYGTWRPAPEAWQWCEAEIVGAMDQVAKYRGPKSPTPRVPT